MKRLKRLAIALFLLLLVIVGVAWLVLPRFYFDDTSSTWKYRSPKHGFSMTLPSTDWKEIAKPGSDAAFHNRKHSVLLGVTVYRYSNELTVASIEIIRLVGIQSL